MAVAVNPRGLPPSIGQKQSHTNRTISRLSPHYPLGSAMRGHRLGSNDLTTSQNCHMPTPITGHPGTSPLSPEWFSNVFMAFPFPTW